MNGQKYFTGFWIFCVMFVLILDGKCALNGAKAGVSLCMNSVIPALFPFLFLSAVITDQFWGSSGRVMRTAGRLLGLPDGAESLLIPGFLGGYPAGAQAVVDCFRKNRIGKNEAERLLGFCCNAGPSFLFGIISLQFPKLWMVWSLWGIHVLSAAAVSSLFPSRGGLSVAGETKSGNLSGCILSAVKNMGIICGWVVLFRTALAFLDKWFLWYLPAPLQIAIWGFLELSNGCCRLGEIGDLSVRFVLCSGMLAFGGLCVAMQTSAVIPGLSLLPYLRGKALQTAFSVLLAFPVIRGYWVSAGAFSLGCILLSRFFEKRVAFRNFPVYNAGIVNPEVPADAVS